MIPTMTADTSTIRRHRGRRLLMGLTAIPLLIGVTGCGDDPGVDGSSDETTTPMAFSTETDITTINGVAPEGEMLPLQDVTTMLDTIDANGNRVLVTRGVRKPGTRVAIHVHKYGGYTCVLSGVITDFVEGHEPMTWPAGTCYYMPPNTLMTAANLGSEDAVLIDNFTLPPGEPTITIREPGWPGS
jgi:quercetin dioxygenase-like cupin family protein